MENGNLSTEDSDMLQLFFVATVLHEYVHLGVNENEVNFSGLADYYTRWWLELPTEQAPTSAQHQQMAQHYINIMADALSDYDDNQHS